MNRENNMMIISAVLHGGFWQFRSRGQPPIMTGNILDAGGWVQVIEQLLLENDGNTDMVSCFLWVNYRFWH